MKWIEAQATSAVDSLAFAQLAELALARRPNAPWSRIVAARQAALEERYADAVELFEEVVAQGRVDLVQWAELARAHRKLGQVDETLEACRRGLALTGPDPEIYLQRGLVLDRAGRREEGEADLLLSAELGCHHEPCYQILQSIAGTRDWEALLARADALEARFGQSASFRAFRAIACSMLGREAEAGRLVDLERQVRTGSLAEFYDGDLGQLNHDLAEEAQRLAIRRGNGETMVDDHPQLADRPALRRLQVALKAAVETYLGEWEERGLADCLPLPITEAQLVTGVTILRRNGRNGQHFHRTSLISLVYHVVIPDGCGASAKDAGALQIGPVDTITGGVDACWGELRINPVPGQLTLFPAHFHHDVIPTGSEDLRISIPSDVKPADLRQ